MSNQTNQHTYLLRLWQSDTGTWRILLQDSTGQPPEGFTTIEDLFAYLKLKIDNPLTQGLPDEQDQVV